MNKAVKIVIPICIVLLVAGIWIVKNVLPASDPLPTAPINNGSGQFVQPNNPDDFALNANEADLEMLMSYNLPIILDFGADSCEPCRKMAPVLIKLNAEMQGRALIKFIDVWENNDAASGFPVQVIPTQVFYNADGTPYVPSRDLGINFEMYSYRETDEHAYTVHQGGLTEAQMRLILEDMGVT